MSERKFTREEMASYIDHTLLKPEATQEQIKKVCDEAKMYHFASVCVNPYWVPFITGELKGSGVTPCCVIGFPLGSTPAAVKAYEAKTAVEDGAREIDMVLNVGAARSGDWKTVSDDIAAVNAAKGPAKLKVIIETCLLTDEEKIKACEIAKAVGADFVKTSTGFSTGGATAEDVALMRKTVGPDMGVKASGGIRTLADAVKMIEAGASRLGASAGAEILRSL